MEEKMNFLVVDKDFSKKINKMWNEKIKSEFKQKIYDYILEEFHNEIKTSFFTIDLPKDCEKKRIINEIIDELNKVGYKVKLTGSGNLLTFFSDVVTLL